jgi:hypothetical protein
MFEERSGWSAVLWGLHPKAILGNRIPAGSLDFGNIIRHASFA